MITNQIWLMAFGTYNFNGAVSAFEDTTASASPSLSTFPFTHGGLVNTGDADAIKPPATLTASIIHTGETPAELQTDIDAFDQNMRSGRNRLWMAPGGEVADKTKWRWTWAWTTTLSRSRDVAGGLVMKREVAFSLPTPYWYHHASAWYFNNGETFNNSLTFGAYAQSFTVNSGTSITVVNNGNAPALPDFILEPTLAVQDFSVARVVANSVVEYFEFQRVLAATERLWIYTGAMKIIYDSTTRFQSGWPWLALGSQRAWMTLEPGDNTLLISGSFGGNETLIVNVLDTYH